LNYIKKYNELFDLYEFSDDTFFSKNWIYFTNKELSSIIALLKDTDFILRPNSDNEQDRKILNLRNNHININLYKDDDEFYYIQLYIFSESLFYRCDTFVGLLNYLRDLIDMRNFQLNFNLTIRK